MIKIIFGCLITLFLVSFLVPREYIDLAKMLRYSKLSEGCLSDEEEKNMRIKNIPKEEQEAIARKTFACIKDKQNFIERVFIPVPEEWLATSSSSEGVGLTK